jgi:type II secretory pathway pseudopilin PulG
MMGRIPGFKGSRGQVKTLKNGNLNPRTLEPTTPLVKGMNNRGFTLIEIIVLIVLAGIIIPVIVVPFATGIRGSGKPEMATTAMYLAHQKMEELTKFDYSQAPDLTPGTYTLPAPPISGYTWQWVISYVDNNFNASGSDVGYKMIRVTVTDPQSSTYNVYSVVTNFP